MKKNRSSTKTLILASTLVFSTSGCYTVSRQSADLVFVDGKMPEILENVANPKPDPEILKTQKAPLLRVGVIDEGVDYLHPVLAPRMVYTQENGKITGVGYDVLGNDSWAHPALINSNIMAFGAELTPDHFKIIKSLPDPLKALADLNDQFQVELMKNIREDEKLKGTIFAEKMDPRSLHLLGAANYGDKTVSTAVLKSYQDNKKKNALVKHGKITPEVLAEKANLSLDEVRQALNPNYSKHKSKLPTSMVEIDQNKTEVKEATAELQKVISEPWTATQGSSGRPFGVLNLLTFFEGFDEYLEVVQKTYTQFNAETSFETKYLSPLSEFALADHEAATKQIKDPEKRLLYTADPLFDIAIYVGSQYAHADHLEAHRQDLCDLLKEKNLSADAKGFSEALTESSSELNQILDFAQKSPLADRLDRMKANRASMGVTNYAKFADQFVKNRDFKEFVCDQPRHLYTDASTPLYQDYAAKNINPYLDSTEFHSHGTHVSGIIISQHPDLAIVPVRVMNEPPRISTQENETALAAFTQDIDTWLKDPVAMAAALKTFENYLDGTTDAERQQQLMKLIHEQLPIIFSYGDNAINTNVIFFQQFRKAVKYVGEQKLKIVNISMGLEGSRPIKPEVKDNDDDEADLLNFLVTEYFKTIIAHDVRTYAPHTLFVIASGNSNSPVDGETRSALPCDVSSPLMGRIAKSMGAPEPESNLVNNILCVGSISAEGHISSFTNDILSKTPFVLSLGEAIPSAIATGDCDGVKQRMQELLGKAPINGLNISSVENDVLNSYLLNKDQSLKSASSDAKEIALDHLKEKVKQDFELITLLSNAMAAHQCVTGVDSRFVARKSGTSMATPAVAGYIGRYLIEKMMKDGITEEEAFLRPEYDPRAIIQQVYSSSERYGGDGVLKDTPMFRDILGFSPEAPRRLAAGESLDYLKSMQDAHTPSFVMWAK